MKATKLTKVLTLAVAAVSLAAFTQNTQTVHAEVTTKITLPKSAGYTKQNILNVNNGRISKHQLNRLKKASRKGMKGNSFTDTNPEDKRVIDTTKLSKADKEEISKYTLAVINSARKQMGKRNWTYSPYAVHFADKVATEYNRDHASNLDADHDVKGICRAAKACGLNSRAGQVYEDESALTWNKTSNTTRTMKDLKDQIYFNLKQMFFGGWHGQDYNNLNRYYEWEHAGDLLGLRSLYGNDPKTKQFGISFSTLDRKVISVHMMGVAKRYIVNYKKYHQGI